MIRALYTAATGMDAQQSNMDNVAHNLANVNTTGFKKSRVEFEDLVYQQSRAPGSPTAATGEEAAIGLEVGLGTRPSGSARDFSAGEGGGMFQVNTPTGEIGYTRSGAFHLNGEGLLVTADGLAVEPQITIPPDALSVSISGDGIVSVIQPGQAEAAQVGTIELALFQNAAGLRALGGNLFVTTTASGEPTVSSPGIDGLGTIAQGFLEESNVSVAEEMVAMILGQRAYEANSRVLKVADEMLQNVNQMVR